MSWLPDIYPTPNEVHPWYSDKPWVVEWLNEVGNHAKHDSVEVAIPVRIHVLSLTEALPTGPDFNTILLNRHVCWGLAPYVGRPFVYMWNAAVDRYGRSASGDARIQYVPPPGRAL